MEVGCRTPTELKRIDDGGKFDRLRREAEEISKGDDILCEKILSRRLVVEFLKRFNAVKGSPRKGPLMFTVCRKPRTPRPRFGPIVISEDPSLPVRKRPRFVIETTSNQLVELANLPRASMPSTSFFSRFQPESRRREELPHIEENKKKSKERKKAIKYSAEEVEQLKQKGLRLPLPGEVRVLLRELGGSTDPERLVIKHLFQTDLSEHHGRFNLPEKKFVSGKEGGGIPTEAEWKALNNGGTMEVRLLGPMCKEPTSMVLKRWKMPSGSVPILTSGWAKFLKKYETEHPDVLREGDGVQVWASRSDAGDLLLALQVIHRVPDAGDDRE